jgi:serine/threonine-protein kinase
MASHGESRLVQYRRGQARYVPVERIAAGGMAEVWRGEAHFTDGHVESVAIKRVLPELARNGLYRRMLEDEARIGMLLRHPNIVRVFDGREVRGTFIIVMELVDGVSLRELNGRFMQRNMRLPIPAALHMAREVARGLEHAHEALDEFGRELDIVHRDVSPHNVLLDVRGEVRLMDFGLANSSANLAERDPAMIGGKFGYLSPELVTRRESTRLLDLFALGVMLWECVTGKRLFQGSDDSDTVRNVARCEVPRASSINHVVSGELDEVLAGLLSKDPLQRYQSARDVGADLEYLLAQQRLMAGRDETASLVRLHQNAVKRSASQTGSISLSSPSMPTTSGVITTRKPNVPRTTASGALSRMPRLSESLLDELDALRNRFRR